MRRLVLAAVCLSGLAAAEAATFQDGLRLKKAEKFEEAARVFQSLVERRPEDADALEQLATMQAWLGRHDESIATWDRLVALHPRSDDYRLGLARVLYWRGQRVRALRELRHVIGGRPRDVDALTLAGDVHLADGDVKRAREYYRKAKALAPADAELDKKLARAVEPDRWRLDVGYTYDHYTNFRKHEYAAFGQVGYAISKDASVWLRQDRLKSFGFVDHVTGAGGAYRPARWLLLLPAAAISTEHHFRSEWQGDLGLELPVAPYVTPLLNYRYYRYPAGEVKMLVAGGRLDVTKWGNLEYRYGFSYNIDRSETGGYSLRANLTLGDEWFPYLGYAHGTENIPPQASAKVTYYSAGLVWSFHRSWGARFDYSYEDRPAFYQHHSEGLALSCKF